MTQQTPSRSDMMGEIRFRVPLVLVIPLAALALIALVAVGMAIVLLSIPKEAATIVALATALNVFGACAVLAARRRLSQTAAAELMIVVLYPVIIGVAIAALDIGEGEAHAETPAASGEASGEAAGDAGQNAISAANLQFSTDELSLPARQPTTFALQNDDTQPHNLSIYETEKAEETLFEGDVVDGGQTQQYDMPSIPAGEYFFRCDLHPDSMVGTVVFE